MARPGALTHRVVIQANTPSVSDLGENTESWATVTNGTVWMSIRPVTATEAIRAGQAVAVASHVFTMRYRSDLSVTPAHRLSYDSRTFEIVGCYDVGERHRWMEITAREVL